MRNGDELERMKRLLEATQKRGNTMVKHQGDAYFLMTFDLREAEADDYESVKQVLETKLKRRFSKSGENLPDNSLVLCASREDTAVDIGSAVFGALREAEIPCSRFAIAKVVGEVITSEGKL